MNRPLSLFLFLFLFLAFLPACQSTETELPAERPADFSLYYGSNAGMLPIGESLRLASGTSSYEYYNQDATGVIEFEVTEQELDELYHWLHESRFDRIKTEEQEVYDRGGESISISWGSTNYSVSNDGMSFVEEEWQEEWGTVLGAVTDLMQRKLDEQRVAFTVKLDQSLVEEQLSIYLNSAPFFSGVVENPDNLGAIEVQQNHLPGPARLQVQVDSQALYQEVEVMVAEGAGIEIGLENEQLIFTPFTE